MQSRKSRCYDASLNRTESATGPNRATTRQLTLSRYARPANLAHRGIFITLEGIDGTGKSTQFRRLVNRLRKSGYRVCATREPGGTRVGEQIRAVLLASRNRELSPLAELTLMYAARAQHLDQVVRPALARGQVVVSDRFNDASIAYQGYGRTLGAELVRRFDRLVCGSTQPDLTLVFDLEPRIALERALGRDSHRKSRRGRFEAEGFAFQKRVRSGYLAIARREPRRVRLIPADRSVQAVARDAWDAVQAFVERRRRPGRRRARKTKPE